MEEKLSKWLVVNNYKLAIFNIVIVFLFLLRSAGYFQPYFTISVNFIIVFGLVMSAVLLGVRSGFVFVITLMFWLFAGILQIMHINVWAERTGIYAYESLVFGVTLFLLENLGKITIIINIARKVSRMPILKLIGL